MEILLTAAAAAVDAGDTAPTAAGNLPSVDARDSTVTDDVPPIPPLMPPSTVGQNEAENQTAATPEPLAAQALLPVEAAVNLQHDGPVSRSGVLGFPEAVSTGNLPSVEAGESLVPAATPATPSVIPASTVGGERETTASVATSKPREVQATLPTEGVVKLPSANPASRPAIVAFPEAVAFDWRALVEHDLQASVPADVPELLRALGNSDLYVQDEVDVRLHPTLTRVWSRKGRRGQRLVRAPGQSSKFVTFLAVDWRDGWGSVGYSAKRTAAVFCQQLDHLVERSQAQGRAAMVILDGAKIHTPAGSKLVREALAKHGAKLRLIYTPAYDPESNPTERAWPPFRRVVTHNHHRDEMLELYEDTRAYMDDLTDAQSLRHIGSPFATEEPARCREPTTTQT